MAAATRFLQDLPASRCHLRREQRRIRLPIPNPVVGDADDEISLVGRWALRTAGDDATQAVARLADLTANLVEKARVVVENDAADVPTISDVECVRKEQSAPHDHEQHRADEDPRDPAAAANKTNYTHEVI